MTEKGRVHPGLMHAVQIPKPGTPPGKQSEMVRAEQRELYHDANLEIRETVAGAALPVRILEAVQKPGTADEKITGHEEMAPDHLIVHVRKDPDAASAKLAALGYGVKHELGSKSTLLLSLKPGQRVEEAMIALRAVGSFTYSEPDWVVHASATPDDPSFSQLWGMNNTGQTGGTSGADIHAPGAWDVNTGSNTVVVAIIDTGIDYTHPDLAPNMWVNPGNDGVYGYNFVSNTGDPKDDNFHGTHCAGTIGASGNNNVGVCGVCWQVKLMALKFLDNSGSGYTSDAVRAIDYGISHGARIMSNSWGGGGYSQALYDEISAANDAGIVFVAAAGNDGVNTDSAPSYPASYTLPNIISVAATDNNDALASFSNYGSASVDIGAPGVNIYSTLPTYTTTYMNAYSLSPNYGLLSGTSMATPHVSGTAALLLSSEPGLSVSQVKQRLLSSADAVPSLANKAVSRGRLNASRALHNQTTPLLQAAISSPSNGVLVPTTVPIYGVADSSDFINYTIFVQQGSNSYTTSGVTLVNGGTQRVEDGKLADWQATAPGAWTIELTVNGASGSKTFYTSVSVDKNLKPGFPTYAFFGAGSYTAGNSLCALAADLKGDGKKEVLGTGFSSGPLYAWDYSGQPLPGWPVDGGGVAYPGAADMNGSGHAMVGAVFNADSGYYGLLNLSGQFLPGWPKTLSNFGSNVPVLADLNGDGVREFILNQESFDLTILTLNATPFAGWPRWIGSQRLLSPVVANVDGSGNEVFALDCMSSAGVYVYGWRKDGTALPGWPVHLPGGGSYDNGLAVGDVDGDGKPDIVVTTDNQVFVLNGDGTIKQGWPFTVPGSLRESSPALADLTGDHIPKIIFAAETLSGSAYVYALNGHGTPLSGWPAVSSDYTWTGNFAPVVGDIDGDGHPDILMGFQMAGGDGSKLIAWHADGTVLAGFPMYLSLGAGAVPAIADIDNDGRNEVLVLSNSWTGQSGLAPCMYAWDFNAPGTTSGPIEWGQYRANSAHTGLYYGTVSNLQPVALSQTFQLLNSQPVSVTLSGTDDHNAALMYTILTPPTYGALSGTAPNLVYTPAPNFHGIDTFTFKVNDGVWDSSPATVSFIADNPPVAQNSSVTTQEDTAVQVPLTATDPDSDLLSYTIVTSPAHGTLSGSGATRTYTPGALYYGNDSFTFSVSDGIYSSNVVTVSLTVTHVNHPPVAQSANVITAVNATVPITVTANDRDGDPLTYALVIAPLHGTLAGTLPAVQYTPAAGYDGSDSFAFTANDGQATSNVATISIKVDAPPVAQNLTVNTTENVAAPVTLVASDPDGDPLSYSIVSPAAHGTLTGSGATLTYSPATNYNGQDSFTYKANDGYLDSAVATVTIHLAAVNLPPLAVNDHAVTTMGQPVVINVLANDSDQNAEALQLLSFTQASCGAVAAGANSTLIYTPLAGFYGADTFTYTITDFSGLRATASVSVSVIGSGSSNGTWPTMGNDTSRTAGLPVTLSSDPLVQDWSVTLTNQRLRQVAVGQGLVYVAYDVYFSSGTVVALDASTGSQKWSQALGATSYVGGATYADGRVFVQQDTSSAAGKLYSFDAGTGNLLWTAPWNVQWEEYYAPLVINNNVYIGGGTYGGLYGFNETTGAQKFFKSLDQYSLWTPVMYQNRLFTWMNGNFREHDPSTGAVLWTLSFTTQWNGYQMQTIPVIANGVAYLVSGDSTAKLHAVNLTTHTEIWNAPGPYKNSPAISNGVVYAMRGTAVDSFSAATGQLLQTFQADTPLQWQPIVTQNALIVASATNTYLFNLSDGTLRQTIPYGGYISLAGNRLYIPSGSGVLQTYLFKNPAPVVTSVWADTNPIQLPASTGVHVAASDPQNSPLTYTWSALSGPGTVSFTANGSASAADSTAVFSTPGVYTLQVSTVNGTNCTNQTLVVNVLPPNQPPSIVSVTAMPTTVTGATTALNVSATDDNGEPSLTYSWSAVPATVQFSATGTNAAKNATAAFSSSGTYALTVTVSDAQGLSVTQSVNVTVNQTPTTLNVSPTQATLPLNGAQAFTATVFDQFAVRIPATNVSVSWNATGGAISSAGLYSAGIAPGSYSVTATSGVAQGTAAIYLINTPPVITSTMAAPASVVGTSTALSVMATDDAGEAALTYTWSVSGPAPVTFSANGNNASKNTTANFTAAGNYCFTVTVADAQNTTVTAMVGVSVSQATTALAVTPSSVTLPLNATRNFSATVTDQFGNVIDNAVVDWSAGGGTITSAGAYVAGINPGLYSVTAASGTAQNSATVNIVNTPPVILSATATSGTVTGTSVSLSTTAVDDGGQQALIYTWNASGPAPVTFGLNGLNSSSSTTATFAEAGSYVFTVAVTDAQNATTTATVNVSVTQTASAIAVSPSSVTLPLNGTQNFSAVVTDQFNAAIPSAIVSWSAGGGTISTAGQYTAGIAPGIYSATATSGAAIGSAKITVINTAPVILAATATPNVVNGTATALSVSAIDDAGEPALIYQWSGPSGVSFSVNNSGAAKNATATFTHAGTFPLTLTVKDTGALTATQTVTVTVNQTLKNITVTPATATIPIHGQQQYAASATDQFGQAITPFTPTWTATGGTVSAAGLYTAGATAGSYRVTATSGSVIGSAPVTVASGTLTGSILTPLTTVNLTTEGSTDWAHWTTSSFDHKKNVTQRISKETLVNTSTQTTASPSITFKWTDGTPTTSGNTRNCLSVSGTGTGFKFTVPATTTVQTLNVYVSATKAQGKLQATLSDGSAVDFIDTSINNKTGTTNTEYQLNFAAVSPGATLTITWVVASTSGSVLLEAATLK